MDLRCTVTSVHGSTLTVGSTPIEVGPNGELSVDAELAQTLLDWPGHQFVRVTPAAEPVVVKPAAPMPPPMPPPEASKPNRARRRATMQDDDG